MRRAWCSVLLVFRLRLAQTWSFVDQFRQLDRPLHIGKFYGTQRDSDDDQKELTDCSGFAVHARAGLWICLQDLLH